MAWIGTPARPWQFQGHRRRHIDSRTVHLSLTAAGRSGATTHRVTCSCSRPFLVVTAVGVTLSITFLVMDRKILASMTLGITGLALSGLTITTP